MNRPPRYLVLGASGLIGRNLRQLLAPADALMTYGRSPFPGGVRFDPLVQRLRDLGPAVRDCTHALILFADSKPDSCFAHPEQSRALNVECLRPLVSDLRAAGLHCTFISTEFVFDGQRGSYRETDTPRPILEYGRQKLAAEQMLAALDPAILILRLAKSFGSDPQDGTFFNAWLEQLNQGTTELAAAADQVFSPLHAVEAAQAMLAASAAGLHGTYHLAGPAAWSRLALLELLAVEIRRHVPLELAVRPCSLHDFRLPEPRPLDVSLHAAKLLATGCLRTAPMEEHCARLVHHWLATTPLPA